MRLTGRKRAMGIIKRSSATSLRVGKQVTDAIDDVLSLV